MPKELELMGKMVEVEIIETGKHFMKSRLFEEADIKRTRLSKAIKPWRSERCFERINTRK